MQMRVMDPLAKQLNNSFTARTERTVPQWLAVGSRAAQTTLTTLTVQVSDII